MTKYESMQELANKADWEGGIDELIFGYGLTLDELPDDASDEVRQLVGKLLGVKDALWRLQELMPEPSDADED